MTTGHGDGLPRHGAQGGDDAEYDPYRAAVDALADPLTDPLPAPAPDHPTAPPPPPAAGPAPAVGPGSGSGPVTAPAGAGDVAGQRTGWGRPGVPGQETYGQPYAAPAPRSPERQPYGPGSGSGSGRPGPGTGSVQGRGVRAAPYADGPATPGADPYRRAGDRDTVGLRRPGAADLAGRRTPGAPAPGPRTERPPGPSRLEARRAARALRPGPGIIASRAIGEVFITCGILMLLFVAYQLWWTNVLAGQQAGGATDELHEQWDKHKSDGGVDPERKAGAFKPGEGFAVIHIPKIDITAPIAQGVSKAKVLDKGMVGHYDKAPLKTAMPWDKKGNFALAGHRNTHGEPFRYINRLVPGDKVVVETQSTFYTYEVTRQLPSTSPSDTGVIDPVPPKSGFTKPGRYVTLTTCTPEFTSKYRLIVWGKMVDERPRSKGKPDALVD
ncbi:class E sortase [Streptomyces albus subsp. chlorinus]|uniref:class E sortase n=1 Tax=Streptomyces albus TaxID=1888 RepID=UPI00156D5E18|nr:class E sortase [Streptomyces albus subsp. chlorinus]